MRRRQTARCVACGRTLTFLSGWSRDLAIVLMKAACFAVAACSTKGEERERSDNSHLRMREWRARVLVQAAG